MPLNLSQPKRKTAISLTPLIDIVFILLLFFMLTSSFVPWRTVDTPLAVPADTPVDSKDNDIVLLTLKQNNQMVWLEGQAYALSDTAWFKTLVAEHKKGTFAVKAEDGVNLQSVMSLADRLKESGAKTVSIANAFSSKDK
ncbi:ExbD/TolR family protein [Marinomonas pollencensis]|uniref:Outer membrane transport energization protein ExbD n=1 Tax=Marinomonas pollencensis TaxID=491954 RepID=A0A3E0DI34_9GAMM|nr:biopolymer transporter ExbD [Marinomonas pollencensis]REG82374.1 outer membrane transport energization protein ExbD [Marinomonas pollencensis]